MSYHTAVDHIKTYSEMNLPDYINTVDNVAIDRIHEIDFLGVTIIDTLV